MILKELDEMSIGQKLYDYESMPELVCPNCGSKFKYKKTDDR